MEEPEQKLRPTCRKRGPWETPIQKGTQGQGPPSSEPPFSGWEIKTEIIDQDTLFLSQKEQAPEQKKATQTKDELFATVASSQEKREKSANSPETHWLSLLATVSDASCFLAFWWHCVSLHPSPVDVKGSMSHRLPSALPSALNHGPCLLHIAKKSFIHVAWSLFSLPFQFLKNNFFKNM